tara:strand:+ start:101 stop:1303 length:1203 start_codon:yes stop_codon:yes gene_type:complete
LTRGYHWNLLQAKGFHPRKDTMAASTLLSSFQFTDTAKGLNDDLAKMGCKYRIRTTSQTPKIQIRAIHSFEDGSKIRASQFYAAKPGDLSKAYRLCLEMDGEDKPLSLIQAVTKAADGPVFSAWASVAERLRYHLDAKGIKWKGQAYDTHMREIKWWKGNVSPEKLMRWVDAAKPETHDRVRRLCTLNALILCCDLDVPNRWLAKAKAETSFSITQKAINPRTIPTDASIEFFIDSISYRPWQVAFGLIATYGLRPHEVFCQNEEIDDEGCLDITSKKTGWRIIIPQNPKWIERWNLRDGERPRHNPNHNGKELGAKVTTQFARYRAQAEVTWRANAQCYDLRHAYAARFHSRSEFQKLRVDQMAKFMGHSEKVHRNTYMRWIDKNEQKLAAKRAAGIYG